MRTPENDLELAAQLEAINQDENLIERERKLNQFYEELDAQEDGDQLTYEQGASPQQRD